MQQERKIKDLTEENERLQNKLKDDRKWDTYLLQRENEKVLRKLREYEQHDSIGPMSGDTKSLKQKIKYYEQSIKTLEKERS